MNENIAVTELQTAVAIVKEGMFFMASEDLAELSRLCRSELSWREFEMTKGDPE